MISLDSDMKELVHSLVEPAELERVEQARSKRSNGVGYYDPDYAWLARELRLDGQDEADLYRQGFESGSGFRFGSEAKKHDTKIWIMMPQQNIPDFV